MWLICLFTSGCWVILFVGCWFCCLVCLYLLGFILLVFGWFVGVDCCLLVVCLCGFGFCLLLIVFVCFVFDCLLCLIDLCLCWFVIACICRFAVMRLVCWIFEWCWFLIVLIDKYCSFDVGLLLFVRICLLWCFCALVFVGVFVYCVCAWFWCTWCLGCWLDLDLVWVNLVFCLRWCGVRYYVLFVTAVCRWFVAFCGLFVYVLIAFVCFGLMLFLYFGISWTCV